MVRLLFFLSLVFLSLRISAEEKPVPLETNHGELKSHYHDILSRPEFQDDETPDVSTSLEDWLSHWVNRLQEEWNNYQYSGQISGVATLLMVFMLIIVFGGLIYIAARLVRRTRFSWKEKVSVSPTLKLFPKPEAFERDIAAATSAENWHAAWLAAWRQFLSRLEHGQWVEADPTLTNREYLAQVREKSLPASVEPLLRTLVDTYDRTIYGHRSIAQEDWLAFHEQVQQASRLLGLIRSPRNGA